MATAYRMRITIPGMGAGMGGPKNPAGPFPGRRHQPGARDTHLPGPGPLTWTSMNISASALQRGGHKQLKMASSSFSTTPSPSVLASRPCRHVSPPDLTPATRSTSTHTTTRAHNKFSDASISDRDVNVRETRDHARDVPAPHSIRPACTKRKRMHPRVSPGIRRASRAPLQPQPRRAAEFDRDDRPLPSSHCLRIPRLMPSTFEVLPLPGACYGGDCGGGSYQLKASQVYT
jgi:hypothetical protein